MEQKGLLHLYYGDGKGKTTAAMGLALRALGSGRRVVIGQFLKGGFSGEVPGLEKLGAVFYRGVPGEKLCPDERRGAHRCPCTAEHQSDGSFSTACGSAGAG